MSKQRKKKAKKRRPGSAYSDHNMSGIGDHKRQGSKLIPPLASLPGMTTSSWADHHMPEMLWAVLLAATLERRDYLEIFRRLAVLTKRWFPHPDEKENAGAAPRIEDGINFTVIVDHTKLSQVDDQQLEDFLGIPLAHPLGYAALRPLLLIKALPGIERWQKMMSVEPVNSDWETLAHAVAITLDHQSEQSTDIRWFKLIVPIVSGWLHYPESMAGRLEELRHFPDRGEMRSVRPFIRSGEMMLRRSPPSVWIAEFWAQMLSETQCLDPAGDEKYEFIETILDPKSLYKTRDSVIKEFFAAMTANRADARLDSSFGLVLYGLSLTEEIGMHRIQTRISGRLLLRALVEACITLGYLAHVDKPEKWQAYRVYGAGQAKLAFLKAQEAQNELPAFMDEHALHAIANEDLWQEFLNIDVGHWADSNLRKLATECDAKELYDRYYDWTSSFIHANWAAVRDTNFVTCHNPLHRLHRIPRHMHRMLNTVENDAVIVVNDMINSLKKLYTNTRAIEDVRVKTAEPKSTETD